MWCRRDLLGGTTPTGWTSLVRHCQIGQSLNTPQTYLPYTGRSLLGQWQVTPTPIIRVAGLPVSVLDELKFDRTTAAVAALGHEYRWLRDEGDALSDLLYAIVGNESRSELRPVLIGLRRGLYQVRMPGKSELAPEVTGALPPDVGTRIVVWCDRLGAWRRGCRDLSSVLAAEKEVIAARARQLAGDPAFRRALSQSSPSLLDELDKWRRDDRRGLRPQKLLKLARYLTRAAAKTSPYSAFMLSGFGEWDDSPAAESAGSEPRPVLELGGQFVTAIRTALAGLPELAFALRVRVNPSATTSENALRFIGPTPAESIVTLDLTPALAECTRLAAKTGQTLSGLQEELAAAAAGADPAAARSFVERLTEAGLLEVFVPVADLSADPLGDLAAWLSSVGLRDVAKLLSSLRVELHREVPIANVDDHRARQRTLHRELTDLADRLALDKSMIGSPEQLCHEVVVSDGKVARIPREQWQPALDDLDVVRRWLTVLDWKVPIGLTLAAFVGERFGEGVRVPFVALYRAVQEEFARHGTTPVGRALHSLLGPGAQPWFADLGRAALPRLRRLHELRMQARRLVDCQPCPDGVVRVGADEIANDVSQWPAWLQPTTSTGCYVQTCTDSESDALRLVLGAVHGGQGRGASRLRHLMGRSGGAVPDTFPSSVAGHVVAEFGGLMGTTLNARTPSVPYEIDYPFTVSGRPAAHRIPFGDLVVVHDPWLALVTLHSDVVGGRVTPMHLGMMADFHLPPAARFVDRAFNPSYLVHPSSPPLVQMDIEDPPAGLVYYPRVEVGRVVVRRARWLGPASLVPARRQNATHASSTDADYLRWLTAWRHEHGIPETCFVRAWGPNSRVSVAKARKPVFVDFANWFLVSSFERQVSSNDTVLFEEALPEPTASGGTHVTEFLIEMSATEIQQ